jgi:hypothetical protein
MEVKLEVSGRIEALGLKEGDLVICKIDSDLTGYQRHNVKEQLERHFFPNHKVLVLGSGESIIPIRPTFASVPIEPDHISHPHQ